MAGTLEVDVFVNVPNVVHFLISNNLITNENKLNIVCFECKYQNKYNNFNIIIWKKVTVRSSCVKFLDIMVEENLSWKYHVDVLCKNRKVDWIDVEKSKGIESQIE